MRALGDWPPALRAVTAVAGTSLLMVLVAWATLLGPDQVFSGPGPRPATISATESCIPLPVRTLADGTVEVVYPDDYALGGDYCDPPPENARDETRDLVADNPPPFWVRLLVWGFLTALLVGGVALVLWLLVEVVRQVREGRGRREQRPDVEFAILDEPDRVADQVVRDADEQDRLLRDGDARNAIVATWHRFEVQGERAGIPRRSSETSSEYALRILDVADADSGPVSRLAELYREARFSDHEITEHHRSEALAALDAIRRSLAVRS